MSEKIHLELPPGLGVPDEFARLLNDRLRRIEVGFAASTSTQEFSNTHAVRVARFAPNSYAAGVQFFETDRTVTYLVRSVNQVKQWYYVSGAYRAAFTKRPTDLGAADAGFRFVATDKTLTWLWSGTAWVYESGTHRDVLANKLTGLATNDTGLLFFATDFMHLYRWGGAAWLYADADPSGRFCGFESDPGAGWKLCDGTGNPVTRSKSDATTATITLPNLAAGVYPKYGAAYTGTVNAAVPGSITGSTGAGTPHAHTLSAAATVSSVSAGTPAGVVSQPTFTGAAMGGHQHELPFQLGAGGTLLRYVNPAWFGVGTAQASVGEIVTTAASVSAAMAMSGFTSAGTPTGTVSQPTFTGTPLAGHAHVLGGNSDVESSHTHPAGTLAVSQAEVRNAVLLPYFRL